jgi:hypothetical protein
MAGWSHGANVVDWPCKNNPAPVTAVTGANSWLGHTLWRDVGRRWPAKLKEKAMLNLLTFMVVAVALGMPLLIAQMWGPIEMT